MIELHRQFGLFETVESLLHDRRQTQALNDSIPLSTCIINQERDGILLITWDDVRAETEKDNDPVTHFGLFDFSTQKIEILWVYNQSIKVVSATINSSRTLLAFVVCSVRYSKDRKISADKTQFYNAFLAEIQTSRVFSLNLERPRFLKVQFLQPNRGSKVSEKEAQLLVFLHRESIGLYHIPLARMGEKGIIMSGQPKAEQIVKKFAWCQWDHEMQCLHYVHYRQLNKETTAEKQPWLSSVQFIHSVKQDSMIDVPLTFPFPIIRSHSRCHYQDIPLHNGIPDSSVNMKVLCQQNGTFCICYQPNIEKPKKRSVLQEQSTEKELVDLDYYVCMVHHAKILHGTVSNVKKMEAHKLNFIFSWLGDYLMVFCPGYFVHLLNVGIDVEPCHNLLLHKECWEDGSYEEDDDTESSQTSDEYLKQRTVLQLLSKSLKHKFLKFSCLLFSSREATLPGLEGKQAFNTVEISCFYDGQSVWKVTTNYVDLLLLFASCHMSTTRLALLHYATMKVKDFFLIRDMFEVLCSNTVSDELTSLMAEYLTVSTYLCLKRQLDKDALRLIPFTVSETFRGQFEKTSDQVRLARLSYLPLRSLKIASKTAGERFGLQRRQNEDLWDILRRHLRLMQIETIPRFTQDKVYKAYTDIHLSKSKDGMTDSAGHSPASHVHFIERRDYRTEIPSATSGQKTRPNTVLGYCPSFLQNSQTALDGHLNEFIEESLAAHLNRYLRKGTKVRAKNVAKEYTSCQLQNSKQLCHLLWCLCGPGDVSVEEEFKLKQPLKANDCELFQLLERYYLTLKQMAYPVPFLFPSFFSAIGFRVLDLSLFLQYVDMGVFKLTGKFMMHVIEELPNDEEGVQTKQMLISRLPNKAAEECYGLWNHPCCLKYFAQKNVTEILGHAQSLQGKHSPDDKHASKSKRRSSSLNSSTSSNVDSVAFPPLTVFLSQVEKMASKYSPQHIIGDLHMMEEVALHHTKTETSYDVSTVNF